MRTRSWSSRAACAAALAFLALACAVGGGAGLDRHRWWAGLGPVLPHETFPADCSLCHAGSGWHELRDDFVFDHEAETGYALEGAHENARCLRCHNDRGPVATFAARGCAGCHEDVHRGDLGQTCTECHDQRTWWPSDMAARHFHTRFPLVGAHAVAQCRTCHPGAVVGEFLPLDPECLTCHADDLARTTNHLGLGWTDSCDRCHTPFDWEEAEVDF